MSKTHNKKRNTALLYEFLVRTISESLVEGDKKTSSAALKILRRHFRPGTQLYKEFRLFNALVKTTVSSDGVASSILSEAKAAARAADMVSLDREKSLLIRNINHTLKNENFYDQPVSEYRLYATIQTLMNEWRKPDGHANIMEMASYEDHLRSWLLSEKKVTESSISEDSPGTARLLMKVMMKKLNEKYSNVLNDDQRELIRAYAFSMANEDQTTIKKKLEEVKSELVSAINTYFDQNKENTYMIGKLTEAKSKILSESFDSVDDEVVSKFMLYSKLKHEISEDEGG